VKKQGLINPQALPQIRAQLVASLDDADHKINLAERLIELYDQHDGEEAELISQALALLIREETTRSESLQAGIDEIDTYFEAERQRHSEFKQALKDMLDQGILIPEIRPDGQVGYRPVRKGAQR
jgi:hypothetical protein